MRALARDVVDARRGVSEYYLFAVIPIVALLFLHNATLQLFGDAFILLVFVTMVGEGIFIGRKVERIASERLPGQNMRGVKFYSFVRGAQFRKLRMPKPRVNRGDQV